TRAPRPRAQFGQTQPVFSHPSASKPTRCCQATRRAQHRRMRQAFAGAHAEVEGEEREFTSRDEGGWESLPKRYRAPRRIRTFDLRIRSPLLYPAELGVQSF